jgi:hypothetical protein
MAGTVAALALCGGVAADFVLDNFEDGNGQNNLDGYWYVYTVGEPAVTLTPAPDGSFTPGTGGYNGQYAAAITFSGLNSGEPWSEIRMGTNVSAADAVGIGNSFDGVDSVVFWAKGPSGLKFRFNVHTVEDAASPSLGYYTSPATSVTGNNEWTRYSFGLKPVTPPAVVGATVDGSPSGKAGSLTQAAYNGKAFTFVPAKVTKLSWAVKRQDNTVYGGTFAVDSVIFKGAFTPPAGTMPSDDFGAPSPSVLLADFNTSHVNALNFYGYSYANTGSDITTPPGTEGRVNTGGISAEFTVTGAENSRYAGIGINLADNDMTVPLDASGFTGIYFEYKTTGLTSMKLEVFDKAAALRDNGTVYQTGLPGTGGEWKAASVSFSQMDFPSWVTPKPAFDKSSLVKVQFATAAAGTGSIAIDNVYFLGASAFPGQTPGGGTTKYALTYKVNTETGGWVVVNDNRLFEKTDSVAAGMFGPTVTVLPSDNYRFVKWDDDNLEPIRSDIATGDKTFTAIFERKNTITYRVSDANIVNLSISGTSGMKPEQVVWLNPGEAGPKVTAVIFDPAYQFAGWSDGRVSPERMDIMADQDLVFTANFETYVAPPVVATVNVSYKSGPGGSLRVGTDNATVPSHTRSLAPGGSVTVTAVPDEGYTFYMWDDNMVTSASRTDSYEGGDIDVVAMFAQIPTDPVDPEIQYHTLAYSAGTGGFLTTESGDSVLSVVRNIEAGHSGPAVTAVPGNGYRFVAWSDGFEEVTRTDIAEAGVPALFSAEFAIIDSANQTFSVSIVADDGGLLSVHGKSEDVPRYDTSVTVGASIFVTAISKSGYDFVRWNDGDTGLQRRFENIRANISITAQFKQITAVAASNRVVPSAPPAVGFVAVAPATVVAGEVFAGPNPVPKHTAVSFFRVGRAIAGGKLTVFDGMGNRVVTIPLRDKNAAAGSKRVVGTWNLKDAGGRPVAAGTYAVRGAVTAKDGTREKVSTLVTLAK